MLEMADDVAEIQDLLAGPQDDALETAVAEQPRDGPAVEVEQMLQGGVIGLRVEHRQAAAVAAQHGMTLQGKPGRQGRMLAKRAGRQGYGVYPRLVATRIGTRETPAAESQPSRRSVFG